MHGPKIKDITNTKARGPILGETTVTLVFATYSCPLGISAVGFAFMCILISLSLEFLSYQALCERITVLYSSVGLGGGEREERYQKNLKSLL